MGSVIAATTATGAISWREQFTPFGERLIDEKNTDAPSFTSHIFDDATGLTYMQARYYDPVIGRFLSTDPVGYQDQFNLYAYVHNDPINNYDPNGEVAFGIASKIIKVAIKGGDIGATLAGAAADARTLTSGSATLGQRAGALVSLASEIASPVSVRDAKAGVVAVRGASNAADAAKASKGTDFAVTSKGEAISIPDGASGPNPTINKGGNEVGFEFTGGSGGKGMDSKVNGVRIMDANNNQGPRVNYMNKNRQTVDPQSGRTISRDDPRGHIPLKEDE